ncbi:MAG: DNA mismatch repair protein MutS [Lachnospiraceae bacterium]|nr:DNA mismatch repair protein MutS [Lachnospiraceae bacterium]
MADEKLSPMMQKYMETKAQYPDCILFYRLGDFYEMFFEDAKVVSKELELTLTGKSCGLEERAPMCGVPFHAVDSYLPRLVERGYKVAICEQVEDPKLAKGLVKREVTRIVTPGTNLNMLFLEEGRNNYLMCITYLDDTTGLAACDALTGDFYVTELSSAKNLMDEIQKYAPSEIICNESFLVSGFPVSELRDRMGIHVGSLDNRYFEESQCHKLLEKHFSVSSLTALGIGDFPAGAISAGATLSYLMETQKSDLSHITRVVPYLASRYMLLDGFTRRNLEICETMREKQKRGSLLWVLDKTKTAMGSRLLRSYLEQPLIDQEQILRRLDAVEELNSHMVDRDELREYLGPIYDLERLLGKISFGTVNPRDMIAFRNSLSMLEPIKMVLSSFESSLLKEICDDLDPLEDIRKLIEDAIVEEPPLTLREGGIIREGFSEEADMLRMAKTKGRQWLADLESEEKERTGIKNLRIKYNKVFGYYIEVTNSNLGQVPDDYIRKQTLTNAERFTTDKLKEMENTILNAEDKLYNLEYELFVSVRDQAAAAVERIQRTAKAVAAIDVFASLAYVAETRRYVRPKIDQKGVIDIKEGRHPVVEQMMDSGLFIANDTFLDGGKHLISIITGPNMAGKSTYMRQSALIVLMAQIGSFVPAKSARIGIVDRIFTRVGASDDLASGQSTFMVEMNEVANILRNATSKSLLILDEIGRGTSTYDGLSIAWAVVEHISNKRLLGAKTLFATHYHELTELEGKIDNVNNYCIAVKEKGDDIVFLRKIIRGGADKSYGIQVAKLAGVPDMVIDRAKEIVSQLIGSDITQNIQSIEVAGGKDAAAGGGRAKVKHPKYDEVDLGQLSLFDTATDEDVIRELSKIEISTMTPLDAMNTLYKLQNMVKNRWSG